MLTGDGEKDEMQKLEERARQLAEESLKDTPKPDKGILFVRCIIMLLLNLPLSNNMYTFF